jgi:hypothetical protein
VHTVAHEDAPVLEAFDVLSGDAYIDYFDTSASFTLGFLYGIGNCFYCFFDIGDYAA